MRRNLCLDRPEYRCVALGLAGLLMLAGTVLRVGAQAPSNDNFANATVLAGVSGSYNGSTTGATREPGEPYHYSATGGHSVWHVWTAPASGNIVFDTRGSFFDTLLAAYTGGNVAALTSLANNDDFYGLQSLIQFPVVQDQVYHIAVDGFGGAMGLYVLNWRYEGSTTNITVPLPQPGEMEFSSTNYSVLVNTPGFVTISVITHPDHPTPLSVQYATSNDTAIAGTDYISKTGTLTFAPGETNQTFTVQILDNPNLTTNLTINLTLFNPTGTNASLGPVSNSVITILSQQGQGSTISAGQFEFTATTYPATAHEYTTWWNDAGGWTDYRSAPGALITVRRVNGSTGRVLVDYTAMGTSFYYTNLLPVQSGTLVFDEFQTSTNFVLTLPFTTLATNLYDPVYLSLSNPRAAPEENPELIVPTLGLQSSAVVQVANFVSGYFAFERANYRVDEGRAQLIFTVLYVRPPHIEGVEDDGGEHWVDIEIGERFWYSFLNAGSDYATPQDRAGVQFDFVNKTVRLTFGGRPGETVRRQVTMDFRDDTLVEFNEDVHLVMIDWQDPEKRYRGPHPYARMATATILCDEQPPGALDREWNPDNVPYTVPPFSLAPGANGQVYSVAVQADGKTVLGGDFTSVNAVPRNRVARMNFDGSLDTGFLPDPNIGADGFVSQVVVLPASAGPNAGKILIAGGFTSFNGYLRNGIARLNTDGSLDFSFDPGTGADWPIWSIALQDDGRIVLGGEFNTINEISRPRIARLNPDGSVDFTFNPGDGTDGIIWTVALERGGGGPQRIYIAGDFQSYDGSAVGRVARLTSGGSLDTTFFPGAGPNGPIFALAVQANGRVLLGGSFTEFDSRTRNNLARLNTDGSLDLTHDPGTGPNNAVYTLTLQVDDRAYLGGLFTSYNGTRRLGMALVKTDGTLDTRFLDTAYNQFAGFPSPFSFQPPNFVNSIAIQPDGNLMVGGSFTNVGGNEPRWVADRYVISSLAYSTVWTRQDKITRYNVARLIGTWGTSTNGGAVTPNPDQGPGNAQFASGTYSIDEFQSNIKVTLDRIDGLLGTVGAQVATTNRTAAAGTNYVAQNAPAYFPEWDGFMRSDGFPGPTYFSVPILDDGQLTGNLTVNLGLGQPFGQITLGGEIISLGGALGRTMATLTIIDDEFKNGTIAFNTDTYATNEPAGSGAVTLTLVRTNGSVGSVSVDYYTVNGSALAGFDYTTSRGTVTFNSGVTNRTITVPILPDSEVEFDETFRVVLTNATGGAVLPSATQAAGGNPATNSTVATVTILDANSPGGRLNFSSVTYATNENAGYAAVTVTRTGGSIGPVSVTVLATNGSGPNAALAGINFVGVTNTLSWGHLENVAKTVLIPLLPDGLVSLAGSNNVSLVLYNPKPSSSVLGSRPTATLWILDEDSYGVFAFSQPAYSVAENGIGLDLTVLRLGGASGTGSVQFATFDGSGYAGTDYYATNGMLVFAPGEVSKTLFVRPVNNTVQDGERQLLVLLSSPGGGAGLAAPSNAVVSLIDDESFTVPAGSLDPTLITGTGPNRALYALALQRDNRLIIGGEFTTYNHIARKNLARLLPNGQIDTSFDVGAGCNDQLRAIALQPDGRLLIGGFFTQFNGVTRSRIARLNIDGTLDVSFNPGAGADNPVQSLLLQPDGRILVGGSFATYNGITHPYLVRLNTNGTLHAAFYIGSGPNGPVYAIALQSDGKIVIAGDFTAVNNIPYNRVARLNRDGSVDTSFAVGAGADAIVRALAVQSDGKILVGGSFTNFGGRAYMVRLQRSGAVDAGFMAGLPGANDSVYSFALQSDEKVVVGGVFTRFNGVTRNRITRLNQDGSTDPSINFGEGVNGFVAALLLQPDLKIVLGGGFTKVDGRPRNNLARLFGGSLAGNGSLEFSTAFFTANEADGVALLDVIRRGGTYGEVGVTSITYEGSALDGVDYVGGFESLTFPEGEVLQTVRIPLINDTLVEAPEDFYGVLDGPTGGADIGVVPVAVVTIQSDESLVGFGNVEYSVAENTPSGSAPVNIVRVGATNTTVTVSYLASANASLPNPAEAGVNFIPVSGTLTFLPGQTNKVFLVPILNDGVATGNRTAQLRITAAGPANSVVLARTNASLIIIDAQFAPGVLSFAAPTYRVSERGTNAVITVVRRDGASGIVSVQYATSDGTATAGLDYTTTSGVLAFADGETNKTFLVPILVNTAVQQDVTVNLALSNPSGGAVLAAPANAVLTIEDFESLPAHLGFASTNFYTMESDPFALITVTRADNLTVTATVDFSTADGTATEGLDYVGTNGTLVFLPGETVQTFVVPIIGDQLGEPDETILLSLSNPSANASIVAGDATLTVTNVVLAGAVDDTFNSRWGADGPVYAAIFDTAEQLYVGGDFRYLNGGAVNSVGRMTTNGTADLSFNVGSGPNAPVYALGRSTNGIVIGGAFTNVNGVGRGRVARLRTNGVVDVQFNSANGADGDVLALVVQLDEKVLIGGRFRSVGGQSFNRIARFNQDGGVDVNFAVGSGANGTVRAIALEPYGMAGSPILIAGDFTMIDGYRRNRIARLLPDGTVDASFNQRLGPDGPVYSVAVLPDGRLMIAGNFTAVDGVPRNRVARLLADGSVDVSFNPGTGANAIVRSIDVQADGKILLAGDFTTFNGNTFNRITRLNAEGTVDAGFKPGTGANQRIYRLAIGSSIQPIPQSADKTGVPFAMWPQIVGGKPANIADFPYQVALLANPYNPNDLYPYQFCGGSILNDRWILSAAHCMFQDLNGDGLMEQITPDMLAIGVGITDLTQPLGGRVFLVDQIIVHPGYNPDGGVGPYDLSLSHLVEPINFITGGYVASPVDLVTAGEAQAGLTDPGVMATVTGWGNTSGTGGAAYPNNLQVGTMPITVTANYPPGLITPDMIMAGYPAGDITTCQGDSGGPLVVTNTAGVIKQAGVVSWGPVPCSRPGSPAVFARVSWFHDWIISQITAIPPGPGRPGGDKIAAVGDFTLFNGALRNHIAVLDSTGANSATFDPAAVPNNAVFAAVLHTNAANPTLQGRLVVAGEFTQLVGVADRNRVGRLHVDGTIDTTFDVGMGPDRPVRALAMQPDGQVIIGGLFTNVSGILRPYLARLGVDGSLDFDFNNGVGLNGAVYAVALQPNGRVLVGGVFTTVYDQSRNGIARLTAGGVVDTSFNPGVGANGPVTAILVDTDGGIYIGGEFTSVNNVSRNRIARLLSNGSLDTSFDPGSGFNGSVYALARTSTGRLLVGGSFTAYNGTAGVNRLARLQSTGARDTSFTPGTGADDFVSSIAVQPDGKLVIGGAFVAFNGQLRNRITRLNADGTADPTINFGIGANNTINTALVQEQDAKIVIGGAFTQVSGQPRVAIARLLGGTNAGGGAFQFSAPTYTVNEAGGAVSVTVSRVGGTAGAASVQMNTADGTAVAGGNYVALSARLNFAAAETFKTVTVGILDNAQVNGDRTFSVNLSAASGATVGTPGSAQVTILDNDCVINFAQPAYTITEGGVVARVAVTRTGGSIDTVAVDYSTGTNGTAVAGVDFTPVTGTLVFNPGVVAQSFDVPIIDDTEIEMSETVPLLLARTAGPAILGQASSVLTIVDNDVGSGDLSFSTNNFSAMENSGFATLTVVRTNGFSGAVSVQFLTSDGTARSGLDYVGTNGLLTFAEGETNKTIAVALIDDVLVEGGETFLVTLSSPSGGANITGPLSASVLIEDDEFGPGSLDPTFDPGQGPNGLVRAVAGDSAGRVVVGGAFTMVNGTNHNYVARLNPNGSLDPGFLPPLLEVTTNLLSGLAVTNWVGQGAGSFVASLSMMSDDRVVIGGAFTNVNALRVNRVARLLTNGVVDLTFTNQPNINGSVNTVVARANAKVLVGGAFSQPAMGITQLRPNASLDTSFNVYSGTDRPVHWVALRADDSAYISGNFASVAGLPAGRVARLAADGSVDTGFVVSQITNGTVYCVASLSGGRVLVGGDFMTSLSTNHVYLARLNSDGSLDTTFQGTADGPVFTMAIQAQGRVVLGGDFTRLNATSRNRFARVQADGTLDLTFDPGTGADGTVYSVFALPNDDLLIGGDFSVVNGTPRRRVARIRGTEPPLRVYSVQVTGGSATVTCSALPGSTYLLEASTNLNTWNVVDTRVAASASVVLVDDEAGAYGYRFYRVRTAGR